MVEIPNGSVGVARNIQFAKYTNVSAAIGRVVWARLATLHELQTVYGLRDLYDLLEIVVVNVHNQRAIVEASK